MKAHILSTAETVRLIITAENEDEAGYLNLLRPGIARIETDAVFLESSVYGIRRSGVTDVVVVIDRMRAK